MEILIGADPELFVRNPNNKEFISAHNMVPGTKYEPYKVNKGAIQVDGMALEFNIDPAKSAQEFLENILEVRRQLRDHTPSGYEIVTEPVAEFRPDYFKSVPESAKELGCEPDFNAWKEGAKNPRPEGDRPFRTASGHIHIGWGEGFDIRSENHTADCCAVVKQLDYALGMYSLLWDTDNRRRSMYGMAGAYRPKSYGVEYRVMSNKWLSDPRLIQWVYTAAQHAIKDLSNGRKYFEEFGSLAQEVIDNNVLDWPKQYKLNLGLVTPPGLKDLKVA